MKQFNQFKLFNEQKILDENQQFNLNLLNLQKPHPHLDSPQYNSILTQNLTKTPKSKRPYKLSSKSNPQELGSPKTPKLKDKKSKIFIDKQKNPNQLFGHWSTVQNKKYHWFLQVHHSHFMNRSLRRMDRIFTSMAKFVGSRQAEQCRSHHQKMEKKYKTFSKILLSLRQSHYKSQDDKQMKQQMDKNEVEILEPLLTEQFLLQNNNLIYTPKQSFSLQKQKQIKAIDSPMSECMRLDFNEDNESQREHLDQIIDREGEIVNNYLWPLQIESSKNYYRLEGNEDNEQQNLLNENNLLDDGYDNKLSFNNNNLI